MAPRSIALTEEDSALVDGLVRSGRFHDADAVVREGLRLVAEDIESEPHDVSVGTLDELRAAVQVGLDDMAAGHFTEFESADALAAHVRGRTDDLLSGRRKPR